MKEIFLYITESSAWVATTKEVIDSTFPHCWHYGNLFVCLQSLRSTYLFKVTRKFPLWEPLFSVLKLHQTFKLSKLLSVPDIHLSLASFRYFQNKNTCKRSSLEQGGNPLCFNYFEKQKKALFSCPVALCFVKNVSFGSEVIVIFGNASYHFCQYVLKSVPFNTHTKE